MMYLVYCGLFMLLSFTGSQLGMYMYFLQAANDAIVICLSDRPSVTPLLVAWLNRTENIFQLLIS